MSSDPITPARFAAALQDLPLSSLALKVAELRNSIAHLDYSNEELRPYAYPTAPGEIQDQDCVDAIEENEGVIERTRVRIELVKEEVERRGANWREVGFMGLSGEEAEVKANGTGPGPGHGRVGEEHDAMNNVVASEGALVNGHGSGMARGGSDGEGVRHSAWTDGTFQTGTLGGESVALHQASREVRRGQGGTLGDEELRQRMEDRMRDDNTDEEGGMHL